MVSLGQIAVAMNNFLKHILKVLFICLCVCVYIYVWLPAHPFKKFIQMNALILILLISLKNVDFERCLDGSVG